MEAQTMKEIFNNYVKIAFGNYEQAEFKIKQFEFNYRKYFPQDLESKLLDIGVGRGEMLTCFKKWGYKNYLGIDISPDVINFCKELGLNVLLVEDTTKFLESNPETYDIITMLDVLEHIPREEVIPLLKAIKISLKRNGKVIIQVPNMWAPDSNLHYFNDFTHVTGFSENSLRQVLEAAGFNKFEFHGFEILIDRTWKNYLKKFLRKLYHKKIIFERKINGNIVSKILDPVFYVVATKI
jgi:2-polyprenyl-3-methyl-5-hydroxy-6-metoxy-1,4-benzoquinol methylase